MAKIRTQRTKMFKFEEFIADDARLMERDMRDLDDKLPKGSGLYRFMQLQRMILQRAPQNFVEWEERVRAYKVTLQRPAAAKKGTPTAA